MGHKGQIKVCGAAPSNSTASFLAEVSQPLSFLPCLEEAADSSYLHRDPEQGASSSDTISSGSRWRPFFGRRQDCPVFTSSATCLPRPGLVQQSGFMERKKSSRCGHDGAHYVCAGNMFDEMPEGEQQDHWGIGQLGTGHASSASPLPQRPCSLMLTPFFIL